MNQSGILLSLGYPQREASARETHLFDLLIQERFPRTVYGASNQAQWAKIDGQRQSWDGVDLAKRNGQTMRVLWRVNGVFGKTYVEMSANPKREDVDR